MKKFNERARSRRKPGDGAGYAYTTEAIRSTPMTVKIGILATVAAAALLLGTNEIAEAQFTTADAKSAADAEYRLIGESTFAFLNTCPKGYGAKTYEFENPQGDQLRFCVSTFGDVINTTG